MWCFRKFIGVCPICNSVSFQNCRLYFIKLRWFFRHYFLTLFILLSLSSFCSTHYMYFVCLQVSNIFLKLSLFYFFHLFFWYVSCLVLSELPISGVWCLTLICEMFSRYFICLFLISSDLGCGMWAHCCGSVVWHMDLVVLPHVGS